MVKKTAFLPALLLFAFLLGACGGPPPMPDMNPQQLRGQRIYTQNCAACHALSGETTIVGPSLAGIWEKAGDRVPGLDAREYIVESILDPGAYINEGFDDLMPATFGQILAEEEFDALMAFIELIE